MDTLAFNTFLKRDRFYRRRVLECALSMAIITCLAFFFSLIPFPALSAESPLHFADVTDSAGIGFTHTNGETGEFHLPETLGAGGAFLDYDNDGNLDLYLVNSAAPSALFRNNGDGTFTDVTASAKVNNQGSYGHGVACGDIDNDGYVDIYVTNFRANRLYHNNGDGTFTDITAQAGVGDPRWSSSATFFDYDSDGYLDLYVVNYVNYRLDGSAPICLENPAFGITEKVRGYCHPKHFEGAPDRLYRNNGDGTFTDITRSAGVYEPTTRGLGVVFTDVNNDTWLDIYVANDMSPNTLFINQGNGTFREEGVLRGVAYNGDGIANGSMGIDAGDYDNDGDIDLWVSNFALEANCLMQNDGDGYFEDVTFDTNLADPSFYALGFGTRFIDFDNDGWLDLLVGNGHIWDNVEQIDAKQSYAQPVQLFRNQGGTGFTEVTAAAGLDKTPYVVRGMLFGDIDTDGDVDVVLCQSNRPTVILRNEVGNTNAWLTVELVGIDGNTEAIGAQVQLEANGTTLLREIICGASYLSGNDLRLTFGLGKASQISNLQIRWHNGKVQQLSHKVPIRQIVTFSQD
jgi:hypothetical protein